MKIETDGYPIVDNHCHPFMPERETDSFEQYWTLAMNTVPARDMRSTILYRMVMGRLRKLLDLPAGTSDEEIVAKRDSVYRANRRAYLELLCNDSGLDTLLVDVGFPSEEFSGYSVDLATFRTMMPLRAVRAIVRIEPIIYRLFRDSLPYEQLCARYLDELNQEITGRSAVALKSVIAYLTGLGVELVKDDEARKAYDKFRIDSADHLAEKAVRDRLFLMAVDVAIERGLPLQIHTGVGDSPIIDVRLSDPLLLYPMLSHEHYGLATYVMVHAGYPKVADVGFLANTYPNVWVDLSEMVPFVGSGIRPRIHEILEMAPTTKIMYGSDGYNIPELFWFAAVQFRDCLANALEQLVEEDYINLDFAKRVAGNVLGDNARRLYRLD